MPTIAERISYIRQFTLHLSQRELGALLGHSNSFVSRIEAGQAEPTLSDLDKIRAYAIEKGLPWSDSMIFLGIGEGSSDDVAERIAHDFTVLIRKLKERKYAFKVTEERAIQARIEEAVEKALDLERRQVASRAAVAAGKITHS